MMAFEDEDRNVDNPIGYIWLGINEVKPEISCLQA